MSSRFPSDFALVVALNFEQVSYIPIYIIKNFFAHLLQLVFQKALAKCVYVMFIKKYMYY